MQMHIICQEVHAPGPTVAIPKDGWPGCTEIAWLGTSSVQVVLYK